MSDWTVTAEKVMPGVSARESIVRHPKSLHMTEQSDIPTYHPDFPGGRHRWVI